MSTMEYTGQIIREAPEIEAAKLGLMTGARDFLLGAPTLTDAQGRAIPAYQGMDGKWRYSNTGAEVPANVVSSATVSKTPGYDLAAEMQGVNQTIGGFIAGDVNLPRLTAGLSDLQRKAIGSVNADIRAGEGIGGYQPYMEGAGQAIEQGQGFLGDAAANVSALSPEEAYQQGNQALQRGLTEAGQLQQYQTAAGSGLGTVAQGTQGVGEAAALSKQGIGTIRAGTQGVGEAANLVTQGLGTVAQGTEGVSNAADLVRGGLGAIEQGTQGVGAAADQAGQFLQADLGRSQALMGQGAQAAREATSDFSRARNVLGGGLGTATQVAQAGLPGQQQAQSTLEMGLGTLAGATEGYNPNRASRFMNPYQEQVTQQALKEMRRQADIAENQAAAQAVRAGAFGGTREGVQRAEQERGVQDIMSQRIFQDYAQNYGQAQQAAMQAFEAQQGRELGAGQAMSQVGGLQSQVGSQTANLLAQQAALQSQFGQQFGALEGQETSLDLQRAQQLAAIGQQFGQQGVQQAQLGQQGSQLQGQFSAQEAQLGLLPANIAAQEAQINAQLAQLGLLPANIAGQQAQINAQLGQMGLLPANLAGQQANINSQLAQLGLLPANIASQQANIGSQEAQLYNQLGLGLGSLAQNQTAQELQQQQLMGQFGTQMGQMGMQEAQLAQLQQQAALGDINAMAQLGQLQQTNRQGEINAQYSTLTQQMMAPFQQYGFLSDIYKNAPSSQMALTTASAPQPSALQQAAGLAGAAVATAKAF